MRLDIITPDKTIYTGDIDLVQLPGIDGSFEIMNNHAPLISALSKGKIKVIDSNKETNYYEINGGVIEVQSNKIIVLAE